jgi:hypothetical protein
MIKIPPILVTHIWYLKRMFPTKEAEVPRRIKTREKPKMKMRELIIVIFLIRESFPFWMSSSKETPVTKERYEGSRGSTQGERKERNPAARAIKNGTFAIFLPHRICSWIS